MRHRDSGDGRHVVGDDNQVEGRASRCRAGRVWLGQYATDGGPCQSDAFRTSGTYRPTKHRRPDHVHRWTQSCWIAARRLSEPCQGQCVNKRWMSSAVCFEFYPRNTVLTRVLALCLSVTSKSVYYQHGWRNRAGFWHGSFFPPILHCFKETQVSTKIRVLTSGT